MVLRTRRYIAPRPVLAAALLVQAIAATAAHGQNGASTAAPATPPETAAQPVAAESTTLSAPDTLSFRPSTMYGSGVVDRPAWRATASVNLWATSVSGDINARGNEASIDESFIDIVQDADSVFGFNGRLELGRQRLSGYIDGTYMGLKYDNQGDPADPADVTNTITVIEFGAIYRAAEWALGEASEGEQVDGTPPHRVLGLDIYAGGRYMDVGLEFDFDSGRNESRNKSWVDPLIGARTIIDLSERWSLTVGGDIGGFGVGSEFAWQAYGVFNYRFDMWGADAALALGYRALGQDFEEGEDDSRFEWDIVLFGPVIGLVIHF